MGGAAQRLGPRGRTRDAVGLGRRERNSPGFRRGGILCSREVRLLEPALSARSQGSSSQVCGESASGLERLGKAREAREEAGVARAEGWLSLEKLAVPPGSAACGDGVLGKGG